MTTDVALARPSGRWRARAAWLVPSLGDGVALGALALLLGVRLPDPDLWWHLRAGYDILARGAVPRTGWYSWSAPDRPWIDHSWLSEVVFAWLHALAGFTGLAMLPALFVAATLAVLWRSQVRDGVGPWTASLVALLTFFLLLPAARPRPYLATMLFLALLGLIGAAPWGRARAVAVALLLGLWANLHAGFIIAVGWLALRSLDVLWRSRDRALRARYVPWLPAAIVGAGVLWLVANPYGLDLLLYPLQYGGSSIHAQLIVEWASPSFHGAYGLFLAAWLATVLLSAVTAPPERRIGDVALVLAFGWLALSAVRHIPIMAVATAPILGRGLARARWPGAMGGVGAWWTSGVVGKLRRLVGLAAVPRGQAWTAVSIGAVLVATLAGGQTGGAAAQGPVAGLPVAAVDVLEQRARDGGGPTDVLFNEYAWGGYLIWRLAPEGVPVFIDGRADLYGDAIMGDYAAIVGLAPGWQARLGDWTAQADPGAAFLVLMAPESLLPRVLRASCGWRVLQEDADSVLLEKPAAGVCAAGAP